MVSTTFWGTNSRQNAKMAIVWFTLVYLFFYPPLIAKENKSETNTIMTYQHQQVLKRPDIIGGLDKDDDPELYVFSTDMSMVHHVRFGILAQSEAVPSIRQNYEQHGVFMRKEHIMCTNCEDNTCGRGARCRDVHLAPNVKLSALATTLVHRNQQALGPGHDCHKAGKTVTVFDHKTRKTYVVDSSDILVTIGSDRYFKDSEVLQGASVAAPRMQQCTHFQRKHCLRGASCLCKPALGGVIFLLKYFLLINFYRSR